MARINTNVASLYAQNGLANSERAEDSTLQRLSTGLRINSGADDPAGLIASQGLQSEMAGISQAVKLAVFHVIIRQGTDLFPHHDHIRW